MVGSYEIDEHAVRQQLRLTRLKQLREQDRQAATRTRIAYREQKALLEREVEENIRQRWEKEKENATQAMRNQLERHLQALGQSQADAERCRIQSEEKAQQRAQMHQVEQAKAEARFTDALGEVQDQNAQKRFVVEHRKELQIDARSKAEKSRLALAQGMEKRRANLPKALAAPFPVQTELKRNPKGRAKFSVTVPDTSQPSAYEQALEAQRADVLRTQDQQDRVRKMHQVSIQRGRDALFQIVQQKEKTMMEKNLAAFIQEKRKAMAQKVTESAANIARAQDVQRAVQAEFEAKLVKYALAKEHPAFFGPSVHPVPPPPPPFTGSTEVSQEIPLSLSVQMPSSQSATITTHSMPTSYPPTFQMTPTHFHMALDSVEAIESQPEQFTDVQGLAAKGIEVPLLPPTSASNVTVAEKTEQVPSETQQARSLVHISQEAVEESISESREAKEVESKGALVSFIDPVSNSVGISSTATGGNDKKTGVVPTREIGPAMEEQPVSSEDKQKVEPPSHSSGILRPTHSAAKNRTAAQYAREYLSKIEEGSSYDSESRRSSSPSTTDSTLTPPSEKRPVRSSTRVQPSKSESSQNSASSSAMSSPISDHHSEVSSLSSDTTENESDIGELPTSTRGRPVDASRVTSLLKDTLDFFQRSRASLQKMGQSKSTKRR